MDVIHSIIVKSKHANLLKTKEVIMWIYGDLSFLPVKTKVAEDEWGRKIAGKTGIWSGHMGMLLVAELLRIRGETVSTPPARNSLKPDLETETQIIEVKTQTHLTTGTACEKILGVPFKYADVPDLFGKPLLIVTVACAENKSNGYGIFPGATQTPKKQQMLEYFAGMSITFERLTDLIDKYVESQQISGFAPELPLSSPPDSLNLSDDDTQQV